MNDYNSNIDILVNRLNYSVEVFRGCSMREMVIISLSLGIAAIVLSCFLLNIFFGSGKYGSILGLVITIPLVKCFVGRLQKYKQNKPKGYIKQYVMMKLEYAYIIKTPVNRRNGLWMIGRRA